MARSCGVTWALKYPEWPNSTVTIYMLESMTHTRAGGTGRKISMTFAVTVNRHLPIAAKIRRQLITAVGIFIEPTLDKMISQLIKFSMLAIASTSWRRKASASASHMPRERDDIDRDDSAQLTKRKATSNDRSWAWIKISRSELFYRNFFHIFTFHLTSLRNLFSRCVS